MIQTNQITKVAYEVMIATMISLCFDVKVDISKLLSQDVKYLKYVCIVQI